MTLQLKLSPGLVQKPILDHRLILTPRMQQAINLVQLSRLQLIETVGQEMEENPVLEELATGDDEMNSRVQDESKEGSSDLPEVTVEEHAHKDVDWAIISPNIIPAGRKKPMSQRILTRTKAPHHLRPIYTPTSCGN
jgi:DNA-directed RNA polymerase specialized sigma54-like protein